MTTAPSLSRSASRRSRAEARDHSFAALSVPAFRLLWIAGLISNIGTWMQSVGAQWQLVDDGSSAAVVALVQTASAAPVLLLALPSGVLGEFLNRRRVLIVTQIVQLGASLALALLSGGGGLTPAALLTLTFVLGAAAAVQMPAAQAITSDVVPARLIPDAASLSSISVNVARAVGPAAAGLLIAQLGVTAVFIANAASFVLYLVALLAWRTYVAPLSRPEPFLDATRAGLRYVLHARVIRSLYVRLVLFLLPANALWALLPVLAQKTFGLGAAGYGLLLAALGGGSIAGALLLRVARSRLGVNGVLLASMSGFGVALCALLLTNSLWVVGFAMVGAGMGWIGVIATVNGVVQGFLPAWVRTRGLSIYQLVLFGGTAVGSAVAGAIAGAVGAETVVVSAGFIILALATAQLLLPVRVPVGIGRGIVSIEESPGPERSADERAALVTVSYLVPLENREEFRSVMGMVAQTRYRTGARTWHMYETTERPDEIVEMYTLGSWREHIAQLRSRHTEWDADLLRRAAALSTREPLVEHFVDLPVSRHSENGRAHPSPSERLSRLTRTGARSADGFAPPLSAR